MQHLVFSIYDSAVGAYARPFFCASIGEAARMFEDLCTDQNTNVNKHPEHFSLWQIGSFDDSDAELSPAVTPVCIGKAHEIISARNQAHIQSIREVVGYQGDEPKAQEAN